MPGWSVTDRLVVIVSAQDSVVASARPSVSLSLACSLMLSDAPIVFDRCRPLVHDSEPPSVSEELVVDVRVRVEADVVEELSLCEPPDDEPLVFMDVDEPASSVASLRLGIVSPELLLRIDALESVSA